MKKLTSINLLDNTEPSSTRKSLEGVTTESLRLNHENGMTINRTLFIGNNKERVRDVSEDIIQERRDSLLPAVMLGTEVNNTQSRSKSCKTCQLFRSCKSFIKDNEYEPE